MNYSLDTPTNRSMYQITEKDIPFAPAYTPAPPTETDQTHRQMTWLFHRPQDHAVFPQQPESARQKKK